MHIHIHNYGYWAVDNDCWVNELYTSHAWITVFELETNALTNAASIRSHTRRLCMMCMGAHAWCMRMFVFLVFVSVSVCMFVMCGVCVCVLCVVCVVCEWCIY